MPVTSKSIEHLDNCTEDPLVLPRPQSLYCSSDISASTSSLGRLWKEPTDNGGPTYLQLDAAAMAKAQEKNVTRDTTQDKKAHASAKQTSCEDAEDPVYITIPVSEPPTPPPRDQEFKFSRMAPHTFSLHSTFTRPNRLSVIAERDESIKSPGGPVTALKQRTTQSMKSPRRPEPQHTLEAPRPVLGRQHSRGDTHISEVISTVKAKVRSAPNLANNNTIMRVYTQCPL